MNSFVCAFSLYAAKTPIASIKGHEPPLLIKLLEIVAYSFVGQPFSKQQYSQLVYLPPNGTFKPITFISQTR